LPLKQSLRPCGYHANPNSCDFGSKTKTEFLKLKLLTGVHAMLELKPNELLIGSGDGSVSLVLDKSGQGGQGRKKADGITRQLNEPTLSCLQEVRIKSELII